jgi:hypothetical protein
MPNKPKPSPKPTPKPKPKDDKKAMPTPKKNQDKLKSTMPYIKGPGTPNSEKKPVPYKKGTSSTVTPAGKKKYQMKKKGM